jgi:cobalamin synthase
MKASPRIESISLATEVGNHLQGLADQADGACAT